MLLLLWTAWAEEPAVEWGFEDHLAPLTLRDTEPLVVPSAGCGGCHAQQYADWSASRHRTAWSNDVFQTGYLVEQKDFCVYCHAPLAEQTAEVIANRAWYRAQHPRLNAAMSETLSEALPEKLPEPQAEEGVSCAVCHWREGQLVGPGNGEGAAHPVAAAPDQQASTFCAGCHEFNMPEGHGGEIRFTDVAMQSTFSEWQQWGGQQTCQDCHMPGGRHLFRGAHDLAFLRTSVSVGVWREGESVVFCLESVATGHHLPTGDLFRHLTLEVDGGDGWHTIHRIGREHAVVAEPTTGEIAKVLISDTSLRPGVPVEVVTDDSVHRWRLRYHYASSEDEMRGLMPMDALVVTLVEGGVEPRP